jgi:hypothetical protein
MDRLELLFVLVSSMTDNTASHIVFIIPASDIFFWYLDQFMRHRAISQLQDSLADLIMPELGEQMNPKPIIETASDETS